MWFYLATNYLFYSSLSCGFISQTFLFQFSMRIYQPRFLCVIPVYHTDLLATNFLFYSSLSYGFISHELFVLFQFIIRIYQPGTFCFNPVYHTDLLAVNYLFHSSLSQYNFYPYTLGLLFLQRLSKKMEETTNTISVGTFVASCVASTIGVIVSVSFLTFNVFHRHQR